MENKLIFTIIFAIFALTAIASPPRKTCHVTGVDIEGPYYIPNAPKSKDTICSTTSHAKDRMIISGRVLDEDCHTPVLAELDIWHADANGQYSSGEMGDYECRAKVHTDSNGYFKFYSIMPGRYDDDGFRPAHVHVKVTPQLSKEHANITTQLYFENDLYLDIDSCRHCHSNDPTLVIPVTHLSDIKTFVGQWDIVLGRIDTSVKQKDQDEVVVDEGVPYTVQQPHIVSGPNSVEKLKQENADLKKELEKLTRFLKQEL